jgi:hypothetical protein
MPSLPSTISKHVDIKLKLANSIPKGQAKTLHSVPLTVMDTVTLPDGTIIEAGSSATGKITNYKSRGYIGSPSHYNVTVQSVQTKDGQTISLEPVSDIQAKGKTHRTKRIAWTVGTSLIAFPVSLLCLLGRGSRAEAHAGQVITGTIDATKFLPLKPSPFHAEPAPPYTPPITTLTATVEQSSSPTNPLANTPPPAYTPAPVTPSA